MDISALPADIGAEIAATNKTVNDVKKLVADAKAQGLTAVTIADLEAVIPDTTTVIQDGEKIASDL